MSGYSYVSRDATLDEIHRSVRRAAHLYRRAARTRVGSNGRRKMEHEAAGRLNEAVWLGREFHDLSVEEVAALGGLTVERDDQGKLAVA